MDPSRDRWKTAGKKILQDQESAKPESASVEDLSRAKNVSLIFENRDLGGKRLLKKKIKPQWLTRAMAEEFSREDILVTTFKEAILYLIFVMAVTICTVGRRSSSMFYITQAMKGQFLETEFTIADGTDIKFEDIQEISDLWDYMETVLMDSFYSPQRQNPYEGVKIPTNDQRVLSENNMLGVPRLRQVSVKENSCDIHKFFKGAIRRCLARYSEETENHGSFGPKKGTAWVYNPPSKTVALSFEGKMNTYGAGGFYQDFAWTRNETLKIIHSLKEQLWITRATRAVFVDFSIFNTNLNLFCICKLIFELPASGGVIPDSKIQAMQILPFVDTWDYVTFVFECMVYAISTFFIVEEIREMMYFKFRYFLQFWSYIDLLIIITTLGFMITSHIALPDPNKAMEKINKHPTTYGNLEHIGAIKGLSNSFAACLLFLTYIKLFKYLNFNKTMGQLNNTLKRCASDILGFSVMFFIVFFAFAQLGVLVFGSQVSDFRNFGVAMFTLLRTILGDFDFESIERANGLLAPLFFLSYIFFVFFVLLNMFLAIINDTYADVKTEIAVAPDEMQMTEFLKERICKLFPKFCFKIKAGQKKDEANTTNQKIRDALRKCGFSDLETEMFFARYNIDPLAEVGDYDAAAIMKELERQHLEALEDEANLVNINDFIKQQQKVEQIQRIIETLADKIENLIVKLEALGNARKART